MLSSITINPPKTKNDLIRSISNLPDGTKFSVREIQSGQDKTDLNKMLSQHLKNSSFSIILIESSR
mgnify:CR=1 FL=1